MCALFIQEYYYALQGGIQRISFPIVHRKDHHEDSKGE